MDKLKLITPKEDLMDRHFHLHTQDFVYRPRLSSRRGFDKRIFPGVLSGLFLVAYIFGAVWFEWWK